MIGFIWFHYFHPKFFILICQMLLQCPPPQPHTECMSYFWRSFTVLLAQTVNEFSLPWVLECTLYHWQVNEYCTAGYLLNNSHTCWLVMSFPLRGTGFNRKDPKQLWGLSQVSCITKTELLFSSDMILSRSSEFSEDHSRLIPLQFAFPHGR